MQRILLTHDGTLTDVIEAYGNEPTRSMRLEQTIDAATESDIELEVAVGEQILRRRIILMGIRSASAYLYAESSIVLARIPSLVRERLLTTDTPIGRLLGESRTEQFREAYSVGRCRHAPVQRILGAGELLYRDYRVISGGVPLMRITEWLVANRYRAEHLDDRELTGVLTIDKDGEAC